MSQILGMLLVFLILNQGADIAYQRSMGPDNSSEISCNSKCRRNRAGNEEYQARKSQALAELQRHLEGQNGTEVPNPCFGVLNVTHSNIATFKFENGVVTKRNAAGEITYEPHRFQSLYEFIEKRKVCIDTQTGRRKLTEEWMRLTGS